MADLQESIKVDKWVRTIDTKLLGPEFVNFNLSDTASLTFTLPKAGDAGANTTVVATLANSEGLKLIGTAHFTFYQDSVSSANIIPGGSNIGILGSAYNYEVSYRYDLNLTDGSNIKFAASILNNKNSDQTIVVRVNFRYIIESATGSVV